MEEIKPDEISYDYLLKVYHYLAPRKMRREDFL
jgi:hypothetical protein